MSMPKSVTKIKKNGIEFISNVDRVNYTIDELSRAALKDVAKLIRKRIIEKLKKLPGMSKSKRIYNSSQYWVRKKDKDLIIGFKHDAWYGSKSELGTQGQPARNILRQTVYENIDEIKSIEGKYLSAIEDEIKAKELINEEEEVGNGEI